RTQPLPAGKRIMAGIGLHLLQLLSAHGVPVPDALGIALEPFRTGQLHGIEPCPQALLGVAEGGHAALRGNPGAAEHGDLTPAAQRRPQLPTEFHRLTQRLSPLLLSYPRRWPTICPHSRPLTEQRPMSEIILINISGQDKPGLTASLMGILAEYNVGVLDIGQAMIHDTLSLGMLLEIPDQEKLSPVLKDVLFHVHHLGMQVRFTPISPERYQEWVKGAGKPRYVVTLLGRRITAAHIAEIARVISRTGLIIADSLRLSGRAPLHKGSESSRACVELTVRGYPLDDDAMKERFMEISQEYGVDIRFQADNIYRRNRRLVVFDMDSTLIQQEVIDEIAREAGVYEEVSAVTEQAMRGELDFKESLKRRVALLEGLDVSILERSEEHTSELQSRE